MPHEARDLTFAMARKEYAGGVVALAGLDLSIAEGELVSMLGPSGCGKTTALRLAAGFEQLSAGRILIGDDDVSRRPAAARNMGMVFQAYSLFPHLTARDNVSFGLRIRGKSRADRRRRADDLLELVGLGSAADRYPSQLSGGMQQRVAIARALAIEPQVLLLDEPLSALDATVRAQLRDEIRRIQTRLGVTTLFVTHDQEEALSISDRVVVLSQGQVEQIGTPAEIYLEPATAFVAEFIGTTNRIPGTITADGRVQIGERCVEVAGAAAHEPGDGVLLLVRPESAHLRSLNDKQDHDDLTFRGRVASSTFLGAVTRLLVDVPELGALRVDVATANAHRSPVGSDTDVAVLPHSSRLLPIRTPAAASSPA